MISVVLIWVTAWYYLLILISYLVVKSLVNRRLARSYIEEGYLQAERGELIDGAQARREIQSMKDSSRNEPFPSLMATRLLLLPRRTFRDLVIHCER